MVTPEHQDAATISSPTTRQLNEILTAIDQLSTHDRTTLMSRILGGSSLNIILNYPAIPYSAAQQVRTMNHEDMAEVLEAIAQHLLEGN